MSRPRGADALAAALGRAGVKRVFTLSGNHVMPVFDAALDAGLELIHTRHEAACVHMADAWARITGEPGIALVTGGPGHANAVAALYTARMADSAVVLLSGHAARSELEGAGIELIGAVEHDRDWEWLHFRAPDGNLYAAETFGGRTQKFRPKPGADRSKLIGAPPPLMRSGTE